MAPDILQVDVRQFLLVLFAVALHLSRTGFSAPADDFKIKVGTPLTVEVKLPKGSLHGKLGSSLPADAVGASCKSQNGDCWEWASERQNVVIQSSSAASTNSNNCKTVAWLSQDADKPIENCWELTDGSKWYGGGSTKSQKWPIATDIFKEQPQITGGGSSDEHDANVVHNRLWFSDAGVAIKVEDNVPLFVVGEGGNKLCLRAQNKAPYVFDEDQPVPPTFSYAVCYGSNLADLHRTVMSLFFELPSHMPHDDLFRYPIWNTYPKFSAIGSSFLQDYVNDIASSSFGSVGSVLLVGHAWTACTGEYKFSTADFPNPTKFIRTVKAKGMHMGLWVHPHVSQKCESYQDGADKSLFIRQGRSGPALVAWLSQPGPYGELVGTVDFTSSEGVEWYTKNLRDLVNQYGIEALYFERGQAAFLPKKHEPLYGPIDLQPDIFSTKYVEAAASLSNMSIVNVGRNTQQYPVLVRMPPKMDDAWGEDNIQSVIPSILQMGISGFPFVLTEVVGGSHYTGDKPDRTLYIRWLQLSALMSTVHLSVGPWEYDSEVTQIANDLMVLRASLMDKYILPAAKASVVDGSPMIRPVWWIAPGDPQALVTDDQFLVGNSLLVAPVVNQTEYRDIYIPPGHWRSSLNVQEIVTGPTILRKVKIPLTKLAYFTVYQE